MLVAVDTVSPGQAMAGMMDGVVTGTMPLSFAFTFVPCSRETGPFGFSFESLWVAEGRCAGRGGWPTAGQLDEILANSAAPSSGVDRYPVPLPCLVEVGISGELPELPRFQYTIT